MKNILIIIVFWSLLSFLTSCDKENNLVTNFYDTDYRIGLWINPERNDTLDFIDDLNLVIKGEFFGFEEYQYRIEDKTLIIQLINSESISNLELSKIKKKSVKIDNLYGGGGLNVDRSASFYKDEN